MVKWFVFDKYGSSQQFIFVLHWVLSSYKKKMVYHPRKCEFCKNIQYTITKLHQWYNLLCSHMEKLWKKIFCFFYYCVVTILYYLNAITLSNYNLPLRNRLSSSKLHNIFACTWYKRGYIDNRSSEFVIQ